MDRKTILLLGISIIILLVMLWFVGIDQVISALKLTNLYIIALAIATQIVTYFLYTLRWQILNNESNMNVSIRELLPMVLVGLAVNNITPSGRGGGEPVRAYILSKEKNYQFEETFATVVADRALDTLLLAVMIVAVIAIIILLAVIVYMCINPGFGNRVDGWIIGIVRRFYKKNTVELENKIHEAVFGFQDTMKGLVSNKKALYYTVPLSFLIWIFEIIRVYLVFLAFGANVNLIVIGEVFIVASLVGMIPLLPGGLGAIDGVMILLYSSAGITSSVSAAATVIERLISFWMATIIGLVILPKYGSSILDKISGSSDKLEENLEKDLNDNE